MGLVLRHQSGRGLSGRWGLIRFAFWNRPYRPDSPHPLRFGWLLAWWGKQVVRAKRIWAPVIHQQHTSLIRKFW